ncbi:hypothetical protein J2Z21_006119 [Streptomyces griseochromogenes]|uniref:Secreted protein n=1 Tax=Streptomyces griseochromogenes TaxID=68214 RepID=A0ABS4M0G8_9ACTN|nr:hypothetical protein [Streptomyces griseochromogenes]
MPTTPNIAANGVIIALLTAAPSGAGDREMDSRREPVRRTGAIQSIKDLPRVVQVPRPICHISTTSGRHVEPARSQCAPLARR